MQTIEVRRAFGAGENPQIACFPSPGMNPETGAIVTVSNYVRSLSGFGTTRGYDAAAGAK